jgi:single-stranded-DNA-specific exonuclease
MTLAVERSVCGRRWRLRACDDALATAISQRLDLPEVIGRVLAARGMSLDAVPAFLAPRIGALLPDPSHLLDLDRAATRLADAVCAGEPVGLLGDYDVDGATSAALLARYLQAAGGRFAIDIPDRLAEGYGPNPQAFARLAAKGCRLVVCLDCGTTAFAPLATAAAGGLEVIVVDHHMAEARLPEAVAVVNPNRRDQASRLGDLAAVGVTFVLAVGINRELRRRGHFATRPEPDLRQWLDLVALGTMCDVVRLAGLNRAFVAQGLKVAARGLNPGLAALASSARLEGAIGPEQLGFWLGPRLNAGGRVGRSDLAARLLTSDAPDEVAAIAAELERLNEERKGLERRALAAAEVAAQAALAGDPPLLLVAGEGWSPGVVGLVASRLVERHHRPAVVIALEGEEGRGSGRSVPGLDLGGAVLAARREGLLLAGGGHPMAAGLTVAREQIEPLRDFLCRHLGRGPTPGQAGPPELAHDGALRLAAVAPGLALRLGTLAPFGPGNPEPRFVVPEARVWQARVVGEAHIACHLADIGGARVQAIAFRAAGRPLGHALLAAAGGVLHLAGRVRLEHWQGSVRAGFQIEDAALP